MKLRIWHTINFPRDAFKFEVPDTATAIKALDALAQYDLFLGDGSDKPFTTVGARQMKRSELAGKDNFLDTMLGAYNTYQLKQCIGGVPFVVDNAQGLEEFDVDGDGEWTEFYDEEGNDIAALREQAA